MKGLTAKYTVRDSEEVARLRADKIEYTVDSEGRLWRRVYWRRPSPRGSYWWTVTRWHVADPYSWFPGPDPATLAGARPANRRARVPKLDVYWIDGQYVLDARLDTSS